MTLEQLRIFIAVAERQHMTRAAEALHLTQSAASAGVAALEARYGARLFDRVGRGLVLSEAGRVFLPEAKAVLAAAASSELVAAVSELAARGMVEDGRLALLRFELDARAFDLLTHRERRRSHAAAAFIAQI